MAEVHVKAVLLREAGTSWPKIAAEVGMHPTTIMRIFNLYRAKGLARIESIPISPYMGKPGASRVPDSTYNAKWIERIRAKCVVDANGCWIFQGFVTNYGYGQDSYRSKNCFVHRKIFEIVKSVTLGPEELVCHSCDVRLCCNPAHLWKGTKLDNNVDSCLKGRHKNQIKTHCPHGHEYTPENIEPRREKSGRAGRACRECGRIRGRERYRRKRDELLQRQRVRRALAKGTI